MKMDSSSIASLIKAQIKGYEGKVESAEVGTVVSVGDGIATVYGLRNAMMGELLAFPNGVYGLAMNLNAEDVGAILLGSDRLIKEGDPVRRSGEVLEVPVGDDLLGRVLSPLGLPLDGLGPVSSSSKRPVERIAPGVMERESVSTPLETGIKAIDSMIPIGRGQRELIIGDRQTGKTSIALDTIMNQKGKGVKCVYVAIGQKNSSVASLVARLKDRGCFDYVTVVSAGASVPAPEQYIAPFAGMAIAEEWMEKGEDALIVLDDLSKHAVAYRALSLLLRRSPGREAYPGDIFYLHSRLLERACKLSKERGGGSITALPIVETQSGDISAYIPTNIISITDGQIFLMADLFASLQRPAIDSGLSVSRVGSSAQTPAMKQVSKSLKIDLATYRENLSFAKFGSDLDADTKRIIRHGGAAMEALKQKNFAPLSAAEEIVDLFLVKEGLLDDVETERILPLLSGFYQNLQAAEPALVERLMSGQAISAEDASLLSSSFIAHKGGVA